MPNAKASKRFARLDQLLSQLGYATRSRADYMIRDGRVTVEGVAKPKADMRVSPALVKIDGEVLDHPGPLTILLHKPLGYVCSHTDSEGKNIYEFLPPRWAARSPQVVSVGRLDKETSGALVLTDQHNLVHAWTSPKKHVEKVYEVQTQENIPHELPKIFASGEFLLQGENKACLPAQVEILGPRSARITLREGRYHQVRRMFAALGAPVSALHRSRFASFDLAGLSAGEFRLLSVQDVG